MVSPVLTIKSVSLQTGKTGRLRRILSVTFAPESRHAEGAHNVGYIALRLLEGTHSYAGCTSLGQKIECFHVLTVPTYPVLLNYYSKLDLNFCPGADAG